MLRSPWVNPEVRYVSAAPLSEYFREELLARASRGPELPQGGSLSFSKASSRSAQASAQGDVPQASESLLRAMQKTAETRKAVPQILKQARAAVLIEKLGAGPDIVHVPGLQQAGLTGKFMPRRQAKRFYKQYSGEMAKELGITGPPKKDVVFLSEEKELRKVIGKKVKGKGVPAAAIRGRAKGFYAAARAHELTHWLRAKKGKFKRVGKPGVRGVLSTGREELAAHVRSLKRLPPALKAELAFGIPGGVMFSTRHAYGKPLRKALMGGKAGKLIRKVLTRR